MTLILTTVLASASVFASQTPGPSAATVAAPTQTLDQLCMEQMKSLPGAYSKEDLEVMCKKVQRLDTCQSKDGVPIYHYERIGSDKNPKRIFAKALIHGDETMAGTMARAWMLRLEKIDPRNTWRVIPVANPDGWKAKTRTNGRGVDLNRNFPTADWENQAIAYWKKQARSDPRRYPGEDSASEVETKCLIKHFEEFKPDFLISVHTPLAVLDFDGPKLKSVPPFKPLPWRALGNFPGSLGRYMWADKRVPVLTIELKGNEDLKKLEAFDHLQDISGTIAIQAAQVVETLRK